MRQLLLVLLASLSISTGTAFGVGPTAHGKAAANMLHYWTVTPFLSQYGLSASTIANMAYDADNSPWHDTYEHPCWGEVNSTRGFIFDSKWGNLDETRRLSILCHLAADAGVPLGHSPANEVWTNGTVEALLETRMDTWGGFPGINAYTGTYTDQANTFYSQCIANAQWFQAHHSIWNSDYTTAGWAGLTYGQQLGSAMLVNYFLAKAPTVANANGSYAVNPGQSATLNSSGSYDPDSVITNADGSYYNNGGGITSYAWDLNNDGAYETGGASPTLSYSELYSLVGPTEGRTIRLRVQDDEGATYLTASHGGTATATATVAVYTPPMANANGDYAVNPGGTVTLSSAGSSDPDGGSVSHHWTAGGYANSAANPVVSYSDLYNQLGASESGRSVTLQVTDNEGVSAATNTLVRIYTNPVANAGSGYAVNPGGSVGFSSSGSGDEDGGNVSYQWTVGGMAPTAANPVLNYNDLLAQLGPSETGRSVGLRVTDNEGVSVVTNTNVKIFTPPVAQGRAQYGWLGNPDHVPPQWDWDNMLDSGSQDPDGGSLMNREWDLNNDGTFDKSGGSSVRLYYSDFTAAGIDVFADENHTVTLRVTDNEGVTSIRSGISMPILVNPEVSLATSAELAAGHSLNLSGSGYDPDGGILTNWGWDLNNDGDFSDFIGQVLNLSYAELMGKGLHFGQNTIRLRITDNDADITGGWAGTATADLLLMMDAAMAGDASYDGLVDATDLNTILSYYNQHDGEWNHGDFNGDGVVDATDLNTVLSYYNQQSGLWSATSAVPEPSSFAMLAAMSLLGGVWIGRRRFARPSR